MAAGEKVSLMENTSVCTKKTLHRLSIAVISKKLIQSNHVTMTLEQVHVDRMQLRGDHLLWNEKDEKGGSSIDLFS